MSDSDSNHGRRRHFLDSCRPLKRRRMIWLPLPLCRSKRHRDTLDFPLPSCSYGVDPSVFTSCQLPTHPWDSPLSYSPKDSKRQKHQSHCLLPECLACLEAPTPESPVPAPVLLVSTPMCPALAPALPATTRRALVPACQAPAPVRPAVDSQHTAPSSRHPLR